MEWDGPIVLKEIQHVEDARLAVEAGMDRIVVSNHGGRQLDGAIGSLEVLLLGTSKLSFRSIIPLFIILWELETFSAS